MPITPSHPSPFTLFQGLETGIIISVTFGAFTTLLFHLVYKHALRSDREWLKRLETFVMPATNRIRGRRHLRPIDLSDDINECIEHVAYAEDQLTLGLLWHPIRVFETVSQARRVMDDLREKVADIQDRNIENLPDPVADDNPNAENTTTRFKYRFKRLM